MEDIISIPLYSSEAYERGEYKLGDMVKVKAYGGYSYHEVFAVDRFNIPVFRSIPRYKIKALLEKQKQLTENSVNIF